MRKNKGEPLNLVLVGGIYGEFLSLPFVGNYMKPIAQALQSSLNIKNVTYIQPHFWQCRDQVSLSISNEVKRAKCLRGLDSLVVAHSKGATDVLFSIWDRPEIFLTSALRGLLLLSPPLKGSFMASWIHRKAPLFSQLLGIDKLTHQNSFEKLVTSCKDQALKNLLKEKVISVATQEESTSSVTWIIRASHWFSKKKGHTSDGLLTEDEQKIDVPMLATYTHRSHHGYLTNEKRISKMSGQERSQVFQNIVKKFNLLSEVPAPISVLPFERTIKVGTYNLGLLPLPVLGVPYSKERLHALPESLADNNFDVLCLQEVFGHKARALLKESFPGYHIFSSPVKPHIGLVTLVKKDLFPETPSIEVTYKSFKKQRRSETAFGFGKGYLRTRLIYKNVSLSFVNLHLTAFPSAKKIRLHQATELLETVREDDSVTFLCGDYNENLGRGLSLPTFRKDSRLNKAKNRFMQERSERLDYVVPVSSSKDFFCKMMNEEILMAEPRVLTKDMGLVEQSDHDLVVSEFGLFKNTSELTQVEA